MERVAMCERTGAFVDGTVRGKYAVAGSFHDMTDHSQKAPRVDEKGGWYTLVTV